MEPMKTSTKIQYSAASDQDLFENILYKLYLLSNQSWGWIKNLSKNYKYFVRNIYWINHKKPLISPKFYQKQFNKIIISIKINHQRVSVQKDLY